MSKRILSVAAGMAAALAASLGGGPLPPEALNAIRDAARNRNRDQSKHRPHQGQRERERRLRKAGKGKT